MSWKGHLKNALFALALASLIAPEADAIEIFTGAGPAAHMDDGLIIHVRGGGRGGGMRHGGGHRGGMHRGSGMHRGGMHGSARYAGGMHRGGMHGGARYAGGAHRNVNRNINRNVNRNVNRAGYGYRGAAWAGRPGWYRWPAGGAIAAGAAIGVVSAAAAYSWAGAPPETGLCWYYTDPSQRQGFWDVCQ